ncbi:MAG: hypothetical protein H7281_10205 [Bacteriovorax sp.]|nr:hypothetical protein [Bacteriovorax sp.]
MKSPTSATQKNAENINTKNSSLSSSNAENILKNDLAKLERNLKIETVQDRNWVSVNNYSISVKDLVNPKNSKHLFNLTNGSIANLANCLKKDFCGMERRSESDAYFDENKTPGHILLGRSLNIMLEGLRINPDLKSQIDWDLMNELTYSSNEIIQVLALELIKEYDTSDNDTDHLLKIVDNFKGNAKAQALAKLSTKDSSSDRIIFVNSLEKTFAGDDPNTVISVVESLKKMNLSNEEMARVSKNLCHYKENGTDDPNWRMIKYNMGKVSIDLDNICTN